MTVVFFLNKKIKTDLKHFNDKQKVLPSLQILCTEECSSRDLAVITKKNKKKKLLLL